MNFEEKKMEFLNKIGETFNRLDTPCDVAKEDAGGFSRLIFKQEGLDRTQYLFSIFEAGEEIIGIKVKWIIGDVIDKRIIASHLYGNTVRYLQMGPLFAGIVPVNDDNDDIQPDSDNNDYLFLLLGNLLFPSSVPVDRAAQILYFWAFINYILDDLNRTIPGVRLLWDDCAVRKGGDMLISLIEVEPFYQGPNQEGFQRLMRYLNPRQTFTFEGNTKPKSMLIWNLSAGNYPNDRWAEGWLLSIEVDPFLELQGSGMYKTMQPLMEKYCIGKIRIEYGGQNQTTPLIKASPYTFPKTA